MNNYRDAHTYPPVHGDLGVIIYVLLTTIKKLQEAYLSLIKRLEPSVEFGGLRTFGKK